MKLWRYTGEVQNYTPNIDHSIYSNNTRQCSPQNRSEHGGDGNVLSPTHSQPESITGTHDTIKYKRKQIMHCDTTAMYAYTVAQR
jgi:hypothetical protein